MGDGRAGLSDPSLSSQGTTAAKSCWLCSSSPPSTPFFRSGFVCVCVKNKSNMPHEQVGRCLSSGAAGCAVHLYIPLCFPGLFSSVCNKQVNHASSASRKILAVRELLAVQPISTFHSVFQVCVSVCVMSNRTCLVSKLGGVSLQEMLAVQLISTFHSIFQVWFCVYVMSKSIMPREQVGRFWPSGNAVQMAVQLTSTFHSMSMSSSAVCAVFDSCWLPACLHIGFSVLN